MIRYRLRERNSRFKFADDIEDFSDNSSNFLNQKEISPYPIEHVLYNREFGLPGQWHSKVSQKLLPNTFERSGIRFDSRVYNGQFTPDGKTYYCTSQHDIKIFDTEDPFNWKLVKTLDGSRIEWTITDIDISPCHNYLVYSTINSFITLINLRPDPENTYEMMEEEKSVDVSSNWDGFGIWSAKFSGYGNEVLAGTSRESIVIFDLIKGREVHDIYEAHSDDINSVCWANRDESQVFFTGSDDGSIKIWDKRTLRKERGEAVFLGHREGITHISSRGDGIHMISNGKDECLKLWDIRINKSHEEYRDFISEHDFLTGFDYRFEEYPLENYEKRLAEDCSLMTFRGHSVLNTLIRCYFSPLHSTAQRYIYTGSADGNLYIYDSITGKTAMVINHENSIDRTLSPPIRDVSWHPYIPLIAGTSFALTINFYSHN